MTTNGVTREQILGFRLARQHLSKRLPAGSLVEAAAVCGIQNSPPGSALLALHCRVDGISSAALDRALLADRSLVQVWSVRAAPLLVPADHGAVFTHSLLPQNEAELRFTIKGASEHLDRLGMMATELVSTTHSALHKVLDGRELTKDELGVGLSSLLAEHIPADQLPLWNSPDEWGHFGESLARFALYAVALEGAFCLVSHAGRAATFVRTDQWLGHDFLRTSAEDSRAELVRRYLGAYGPSTVSQLAQWAGIAPEQARRIWQLVEVELAGVCLAGKTLWLLKKDLPILLDAGLPAGIRLLPPHDPYLAPNDRKLLMPDKGLHGQIWRPVGSPGVVLNDGEITATWRARKGRETLDATVTAFTDLSLPVRRAIEAEFATLAPLRGCRTAAVTFAA